MRLILARALVALFALSPLGGAHAQTLPDTPAAAAPAAPAPAAAPVEGALAWRAARGVGEARALVSSCADCQDAPLAVSCAVGVKALTFRTSIATALQAGDVAEIRFDIDRDTFRRDVTSQPSAAGASELVGAIDADDPVLSALASGKTLIVSLGETRLPLPLKGSAAALRDMRAGCRAAPAAPASVATPSPDAVAPPPGPTAVPPSAAPPPAGASPPVLGITPIPDNFTTTAPR